VNKAVLVGMALALAVSAEGQREPAGDEPEAQQQSEHDEHAQQEPTQQMHTHMQAMRAQMARMNSVEDPAERQRLMHEHMQSMDEHMSMMEQNMRTMQQRMAAMQQMMDQMRALQTHGTGPAAPVDGQP
jgi:predicted RNase H-like nuclease (RuvC/YqgF family)